MWDKQLKLAGIPTKTLLGLSQTQVGSLYHWKLRVRLLKLMPKQRIELEPAIDSL